MEKTGQWTSLNNIDDFQKYYRDVMVETRKWRSNLFSDWSGYCYYQPWLKLDSASEYNDLLYPIIEHKISISYGYKNKMSPSEIGNISNLCISSRSINSQKKHRTEKEFLVYKANKILEN